MYMIVIAHVPAARRYWVVLEGPHPRISFNLTQRALSSTGIPDLWAQHVAGAHRTQPGPRARSRLAAGGCGTDLWLHKHYESL